MSVIRTLEHFTQDEVDNAVTETLAKDLPYGGNRPYVIGTILRDPTTGEYFYGARVVQKNIVCVLSMRQTSLWNGRLLRKQ